MKERHGIDLTREHVLQFGNKVKHGLSKPVRKTSTHRSRHIVEWHGKEFLIAYDNARHVPITVFWQSDLEKAKQYLVDEKGYPEDA